MIASLTDDPSIKRYPVAISSGLCSQRRSQPLNHEGGIMNQMSSLLNGCLLSSRIISKRSRFVKAFAGHVVRERSLLEIDRLSNTSETSDAEAFEHLGQCDRQGVETKYLLRAQDIFDAGFQQFKLSKHRISLPDPG